MRILHLVTVMTPQNAFGGPVTVALNQCRELSRRGHDVVIAAACRDFEQRPALIDGVSVRLFNAHRVLPGAGFSGLAAVGLLRWVRRHGGDFDVVHAHLARDLVTLPAAALAQGAGTPVVAQPHGMIDPSVRFLARPLDAVLTRRTLSAASTVFYLTADELAGLTAVQREHPFAAQVLRNGVEGPTQSMAPSDPPEVLFCGRLAARKRPSLFVEVAERLLAEGVDARFRLVGADEGEAARVADGIARVGRPDRLTWDGALPHAEVLARIADASVVALPSVDEPYPMVVLEALARSRPVIVTDTCGLAPAIEAAGCGVVVDSSPEAFDGAVRTLLASPAVRADMGERAGRVASERFTMGPVVNELETAYAAAAARRTRS